MLFKNLFGKEKRLFTGCGAVVAERCVTGSDDSAVKLKQAAMDLKDDVYERFKIELIHCRIYIAFHIFKYELDIKNYANLDDKFENWWAGFQLWLSKNWTKPIYEVMQKIETYSRIFSLKGSRYSELVLDDSILDDLLINSGIKTSELSHFDTTDLKKIFIEDCIEHQSYIDTMAFFVCLYA